MNQTQKFAKGLRMPVVAMQWAEWAGALAGQHMHTTARHQRDKMTLAHTRLIFQSVRWETNAWSFAPQIRLAITPFLPVSILKTTNEMLMRSEMNAARTARERGATEQIIPDARTHREPGESDREHAWLPHPSPAVFVLPGATLAKQILPNTALARIVARRNDEEISSRAENLLLEPTRQLLQRVTQSLERVEERTTREPVVLHNPMVSGGTRAAQADHEFHQFGQPTPIGRVAKPVPWEIPTAASLNLEELTDQVARRIDNRITAYRERRGKGA